MRLLEHLFADHFFPSFIRYWKIEHQWERSHKHPDLIVLLSYATCKSSLTRASEEIIRRGVEYHKHVFLRAQLAVTTCEYVLPDVEEVLKRYMIGRNVPEDKIVWARNIRNTVHEAQRIKEETIRCKIDPKIILVITGELHSRSALRVYRKTFPGARVLIETIPYYMEFQWDHPILAQRSLWRWFLANIMRQATLHIPIFGFRIVCTAQHNAVIE